MSEPRPLGRTSLWVSPLGLGAGRIGGDELDDRAVDRLLGSALEAGVNFIDAARSYGHAEARIGRWLAGRRDRPVIATKGGYGIPGVPDWTGACITAGVDAALERLGTDVLDLFFLHSCPLEVLERGEVVDALESAVRAGKVRVMGYSGDGEPLSFALRSGRFGAVETSVSLCDQRAIDEALGLAEAAGIGVIAKRPLANAAWRHVPASGADGAHGSRGPEGFGDRAEEVYLERLLAMGLRPEPGTPWDELSIRFSAFQPAVGTAIVGTARPEHLQRCARAIAKGALPSDEVRRWRDAFRAHDRGWVGQI